MRRGRCGAPPFWLYISMFARPLKIMKNSTKSLWRTLLCAQIFLFVRSPCIVDTDARTHVCALLPAIFRFLFKRINPQSRPIIATW